MVPLAELAGIIKSRVAIKVNKSQCSSVWSSNCKGHQGAVLYDFSEMYDNERNNSNFVSEKLHVYPVNGLEISKVTGLKRKIGNVCTKN